MTVRHLQKGELALYDVSCSYFEGRTCPLARLSDTAEFGFVTALKAPQVRKLVKDGFLQRSVFDQLNLAEIACEQLYPGQRLVV